MLQLIKKFGPGLLFAGAAIGVSHLVQSTRAGSEYGFGLLWALLLVHVFKYPFFRFGPTYTIATGESILKGYERLGKPVIAIFFILNIATIFTIQTAVTIVTAGLAANLFGITTNPVYWSIAITTICLALLIIGRYQLLDKIMKVIVVTLTICTFTAVILAKSNFSNNIAFTQILPENATGIAFLIAFMGWMPAPIDLSAWQSVWTLEKLKTNQKLSLKDSLLDFNIGYLATIIIGVLFITLGALVMHDTEHTFSSQSTTFAAQLIDMYTKSLGNGAFYIITIAAFTTMFSTTLTCIDASPRVMAEATKLLFSKYIKHSYVLWLGILAIGTIIILLFFLSEMGTLVQIATVLSFITAPFYAIVNYILITSKHTPKEYQPKTGLKIVSFAGILFLVGFSVYYLYWLYIA